MYKLLNWVIVNVKYFVLIFVNFVLFFEYCIMFDVFVNCEFFNCRKKLRIFLGIYLSYIKLWFKNI